MHNLGPDTFDSCQNLKTYGYHITLKNMSVIKMEMKYQSRLQIIAYPFNKEEKTFSTKCTYRSLSMQNTGKLFDIFSAKL